MCECVRSIPQSLPRGRPPFPPLGRGLTAVLAVLNVVLGALVHVFQRVRSLYGQFGGVHHGQGALLWVQPGLVIGRVLLFPLAVVLSRLVHAPHHLEGVGEEVMLSEGGGLTMRVMPHLHSFSVKAESSCTSLFTALTTINTLARLYSQAENSDSSLPLLRK